MQTTFEYQYQINEDEKPFRFILPTKPQYKQYPQQLQKLFKEVERCPFPKIRTLIILFKENTQPQTDIDYSDLLKQKYQSFPEYKITDEELNRCIMKGEHLLLKLQQLLFCTTKYNGLFEEVRNSLEGEYLQKMLDIKNEENKKKQTIKGQVLDDKKLQFYKSNQENYENTNNYVLDIENNYFSFLLFSGQFERAMILVGGIQNLQQRQRNRGEDSLRESRSFSNTFDFQKNMKVFIARIKQVLQRSFDILFQWRQKVKNNETIKSIDLEKMDEAKLEWKEIYQKSDDYYAKLGGLSQNIESDRQKNRKIFQGMSEKYPKFLPDYIKARQVYEVSSKKSYYQQVIKDQKRMLCSHLKKNYGMIVPYTLSEEFKRIIEPVNESEKKYLKELFAQQLESLEFGLNYINRDYEIMYKEACQQNSGVRQKVARVLQKFNRYEKEPENEFVNHLSESCRKLLRIAK